MGKIGAVEMVCFHPRDIVEHEGDANIVRSLRTHIEHWGRSVKSSDPICHSLVMLWSVEFSKLHGFFKINQVVVSDS